MGVVRNWLNVTWNNVRNVGIADILDILIITFLIYKVLCMMRGKSAAKVVRSVVIILLITWVSDLVGFNVLNFLLSNTIQIGLIALVIMFQPEIRRALEQAGERNFLGSILSRGEASDDMKLAIDQTVEACAVLARDRVGALIVFEKTMQLDSVVNTGTVINADVSAELLKNLFFPKAALHDGAVIIRDGRIAAAGCMLPLTDNHNLSRDLGMRHRAGIGMSEKSDALIVIVSEERGSISVADGGMIKMNLGPELLARLLKNEFQTEPAQEKKSGKLRIRLPRRKSDDQKIDWQ